MFKSNWVHILSLSFLLTSLLLPATARAVKIEDYVFHYQCGDFQKDITMHVEYHGNRVEVTYFNEFGDKDITVFRDGIHTLNATYYNPEREIIGKTRYDYVQKKVYVTGSMDAVYDLIEPIFDNNGANFYIFSVFYPEPGKTSHFRMVQSNLSRITDGFQRLLIRKLAGSVEMQLKHTGQETLVYQGQSLLTDKYEFAIREGSASSALWSHKYYFWYSSDKRLLIKQQGVSQDKKENLYSLIEYTEWERPEPQLPSL